MRELGSLVQRDHDDLHDTLRELGDAITTDALVIEMVEHVRTRFEAHAEAEIVALGAMLEQSRPPPSVFFMVSQVTASHIAQETALAQLLQQRIGSPAFLDRARYLSHLMVSHAEHEAACLHPALSDHLPREIYRALATSYAIERERRLALRDRARRSA